ncbi:MFS transporter, putative [Bodo saltans]|uniref:MFS transporter, putative n=1 Tax=Bodo saltans TaxID=75058 RepID=A0A0S4JUB8_BODSA|nr:MFS transporter, putative [Bodo saltans]|eukprot:CUG92687.1 MFS transporter, putative [Bodo saltans]
MEEMPQPQQQHQPVTPHHLQTPSDALGSIEGRSGSPLQQQQGSLTFPQQRIGGSIDLSNSGGSNNNNNNTSNRRVQQRINNEKKSESQQQVSFMEEMPQPQQQHQPVTPHHLQTPSDALGSIEGRSGSPLQQQQGSLTFPQQRIGGSIDLSNSGGSNNNNNNTSNRRVQQRINNGGGAATNTTTSNLGNGNVVVVPMSHVVSSDDSDDGSTLFLHSPSGPMSSSSSKYHPRQQFTLSELLGLFAVSFSYAFCFNTLNTIVIPKEIERLTSARQSMWVGLVMATGAVSQLATPIVGAWSDRAGGQRTPYLVYGTFIAILGIVCFLFAESFHEISFLMVAHVTTTIGLSVQYSMVTALLNDYVPEEHTGKGSGAMAILAIFGSGAGYVLFALNAPLTYSYCAYILASVVCLGICVIHIPVSPPQLSAPPAAASSSHQPSAMTSVTGGAAVAVLPPTVLTGNHSDHDAAGSDGVLSPTTGRLNEDIVRKPSHQQPLPQVLSGSVTTAVAQSWIDSLLSPLSMPSPSRFPDFFFACCGRALFNSGLAGQVYLVYYLRDIIGASNPVQITSMVAVMALFGGIVGALPSGVISDKVGKKPVIYGSITICVITLLCFMIVRDVTTLHMVGFMYGVGNVAYLSVDYALGVQALPKRKGLPIDPAKDLGVFAMSATVGQLFGQVIYGAILDQYGTMTATGTQYNIWGFVAIYALGGFCFILSGISTSYIRNVR